MNVNPINFKMHPPSICTGVEDFIQYSLKDLKRSGVVIGLSGGLDSAVAAVFSVRSLGTEKIHLLYMPERDSSPVHCEHARRLADHLGVPLTIMNITSVLTSAGTYRILGLGLVPCRKLRKRLVEYGRRKLLKHDEKGILSVRLSPGENSWAARGNAYGMTKHRIRAALVYQYAEIHNLMVIGAANRTEFLTGTFCKWGIDHCADIMPLLHLFRSQLEEVAEYIGVPEYIRSKRSDPDLYPTTLDKGVLLGGFETADIILFNLENGIDQTELYKVFDSQIVDYIYHLYTASAHMRESPYHL